MKRDQMRGELRKLRRKYQRLNGECNKLMWENTCLRTKNVFFNAEANAETNINIQEFKQYYSYSDWFYYDNGPIALDNLKKKTVRIFLRYFSKFLEQSGMIHQEIKEDRIETRIKFALFPIKAEESWRDYK